MSVTTVRLRKVMTMATDTGRVSTWLGIATLLFVNGLGAPAAAQNTDIRSPGRSSECLPRATRAKEHCDPITTVLRVEAALPVTLDLPALRPIHCAAVIAIEFTQRDTVVDVAGTISNSECAACSGDYEVLVSVRNESAGLKTLRFVESWTRQDDQPVSFSAQYPIGENVDIVGVRAQSVRCACLAVHKE